MLGAPLLAADVALSILSGTGFLSIDVGGAEATSGGLPVRPPASAADPLRASGPLPTIGPVSATQPGVNPGPTQGGAGEVALDLRTACQSTHA